MKILIDMNLSPAWCAVLGAAGWDCVHWSQFGSPGATDQEIMQWAATEGRVVLTHDLDFGAILSATQATKPSVVQFRTQDLRPKSLASLVVAVLRQHERDLAAGALVVVDVARARVRLLPLPQRKS
jgi:predicted nuclease of predicted toxin-antitoxin system